MEGWFEFALERYNYWIVIILMMTGLYIVFARGNLVKKVVGLNLFQTSVFIFYITIGKISGGTAPIFVDGHGDGGHGDDHGEDGQGKDGYADGHEAPEAAGGLHDKIENLSGDLKPNDLQAAAGALGPAQDAADAPSLHEAPANAGLDKIANAPLTDIEKPSAEGFELAPVDAHGAADALTGAVGEVVYTNPLPHVLILTAIVVGVATTAVGLALAVRIREAYGTIEEDELHALDGVAEFGAGAAASAPPSTGTGQ